MHVAYEGRVANVADLRDGSVFLADLERLAGEAAA